MSFNIGLSGLYAANKQLDVTGNNIANVNTTGPAVTRWSDLYIGELGKEKRLKKQSERCEYKRRGREKVDVVEQDMGRNQGKISRREQLRIE